MHSNLAEQLYNNGMLRKFYTMYAYQKIPLLRLLPVRKDKENIPVDLIETFPSIARVLLDFSLKSL